LELNNREEEVVNKVMSCKEYKNKLKKFVNYSTEKKIGLKHLHDYIGINKFTENINENNY